jgi:uncharacterized membrane protein
MSENQSEQGDRQDPAEQYQTDQQVETSEQPERSPEELDELRRKGFSVPKEQPQAAEPVEVTPEQPSSASDDS